MNIPEIFAFSFEVLENRRLRSSLTILMVVVGAGLLVAADGTSEGFNVYLHDEFRQIGANILVVRPQSSKVEVVYDIIERMAKVQGVSEVVPYIQQAVLATSKGREQIILVMGLDHSKLPLLYPSISIEAGTFVSNTDTAGILLGNGVAYSSEEGRVFTDVGQTVRLKYTTFEEQRPVTMERTFVVRGVLKPVGGGVIPLDSMAFISKSAADAFFDRGGSFDGIYVLTESPSLNEEVQRRMTRSFGEDFTVTSPKTLVGMIQSINTNIGIFMQIVSFIALVVASVGIVTTLHTSVMERIREIGLLKALGFKNRLILTLFLNEATIIGTVGGTIGIFFGVGLAQFISVFFGKAWSLGGLLRVSIIPVFSFDNFVSTLILCVFLSMASGLYPAWKASKLDPVISLRHE